MEHSGLGRYGDKLNPYGDLEAAAQIWCVLKPGALFFLGVPTATATHFQDSIEYNAHRFYGTHRLAQIFANFKLIEVIASPKGAEKLHRAAAIFVLEKLEPQE